MRLGHSASLCHLPLLFHNDHHLLRPPKHHSLRRLRHCQPRSRFLLSRFAQVPPFPEFPNLLFIPHGSRRFKLFQVVLCYLRCPLWTSETSTSTDQSWSVGRRGWRVLCFELASGSRVSRSHQKGEEDGGCPIRDRLRASRLGCRPMSMGRCTLDFLAEFNILQYCG